ncbi:hypothetical protein SAMD00079811_28140 [Scytonema sp. HK-05]|nr:hypothetical protein SAMD00079811_28140 [Scytonema sp. HK-05]
MIFKTTDAHEMYTSYLSVSICVHLWFHFILLDVWQQMSESSRFIDEVVQNSKLSSINIFRRLINPLFFLWSSRIAIFHAISPSQKCPLLILLFF